MSSLSTILNGEIDAAHLHSKCWLQGLAGWLMVVGLVFGAVFNCISSAKAYMHPFAHLNLEAFEDFADFTNVNIKHIEYTGLAATALYITAFALLFRAVNSVHASWRTLLITVTALAMVVHGFGGWALYTTSDAFLRIEEAKSLELAHLMGVPSFNITNVTTSLQSFSCAWDRGSCQLGPPRVLNAACYPDTATTGIPVTCPAMELQRSTTPISFPVVLNQLCGPQSIFAVNGGVGDFFTIYGYNYFFILFIMCTVGFILTLAGFIVYVAVLGIMKSYGGWHFHEWLRESSDDGVEADKDDL